MAELGQIEKNSVRVYVFRFALELGHCSTLSACLKGATNGSRRTSFDYLVSARKHHGRYFQSERLRGLEVDKKLKLCRLLNWQIGSLFAFEELVDISCGAAKDCRNICSIGHEAARLKRLARVNHERKSARYCQLCD